MRTQTLDTLEEKWLSYFEAIYPHWDNLIREGIDNLKQIICDFIDSGCADPHFESEILSKHGCQYEQRLAEMLFFDGLRRSNFEPLSQKEGPDFLIEKDGVRIWFELITPEPDEFMHSHLNDKTLRLHPDAEKKQDFYQHAMLKITAAIKEKKQKLIKYLSKKYIGADDVYVIVINDTLFWPNDLPMIGISHVAMPGSGSFPLAANCVYGIGNPFWERISEAGEFGIRHHLRTEIKTKYNSIVPTNIFLNDGHNRISAILQVTLREDYGIARVFAGHKEFMPILAKNNVIRNPAAVNSLPYGVIDGDECSLDQVFEIVLDPENKNRSMVMSK